MTTTHTPNAPAATERQTSYLTSLVKYREVPATVQAQIEAELPTMTKARASMFISALAILPQKPKPKVKIVPAPGDEMARLLADLPKSKYAVPVDEIELAVTATRLPGDLIFIEVREFKGRVFMRRLVGAPGQFSRFRLATEDALTFARKIKTDPQRFAKLFADHYSCCARCGAELTDQESRTLGLGPTCRKAFGI